MNCSFEPITSNLFRIIGGEHDGLEISVKTNETPESAYNLLSEMPVTHFPQLHDFQFKTMLKTTGLYDVLMSNLDKIKEVDMTFGCLVETVLTISSLKKYIFEDTTKFLQQIITITQDPVLLALDETKIHELWNQALVIEV